MLKFRYQYALLTVILFLIEVFIAVFVHDRIIRPYIGDLLVMVLVYTAVRSILNIRVNIAVIASLLFCYTIEILQYFQLVTWLGWQNSKLACIVIGNSFSFEDLLAYTLGAIFVFLIERNFNKE